MIIQPRKMSGVFEIMVERHYDHRGFFSRTYDKKLFASHGIHRDWLQDNHSRTIKKGTVRGLHFQFPPYTETKLVRVAKGAILDVFVDLRCDSPTFGCWDSIELSEDNGKMIYIPRGFAHGFCSLTDNCDVIYRVDNVYAPDCEGGIIWNDETLKIAWPVSDPILSQRDASLHSFNEFVTRWSKGDLSWM